MVKAEMLKSVIAVTGGAAPFGPALIESFMEKVKPNGHDVEFREGIINIMKIHLFSLSHSIE